MSDPKYITDEMNAAIGSEVAHAVSYPVSASDIRRWAIAIYYPEPPPPQFFDPEDPIAKASGGIVAPEDFNPFAWMVAEPKGELTGYTENAVSYEAMLGIAEVPTKFMLNGGSMIEYGEPIRPGDVITSSTTLTSYEERQGRLGDMLFTRVTNSWQNQNGASVKSNILTLIRY